MFKPEIDPRLELYSTLAAQLRFIEEDFNSSPLADELVFPTDRELAVYGPHIEDFTDEDTSIFKADVARISNPCINDLGILSLHLLLSRRGDAYCRHEDTNRIAFPEKPFPDDISHTHIVIATPEIPPILTNYNRIADEIKYQPEGVRNSQGILRLLEQGNAEELSKERADKLLPGIQLLNIDHVATKFFESIN